MSLSESLGPLHGGQDGGGDPGHLPPGGPGDPLPDPDQRARATRHPGGLQTGPEQTQRQILLQVRGRRLRVSHVIDGIDSNDQHIIVIVVVMMSCDQQL